MAEVRGRRRADRWWQHLILVLACLWSLAPVLWILSASLQPRETIVSDRLSWWPAPATLANYRVLLTNTEFLRWFGNSIVVAAVTTAVGLFFASTAAFAFSQFRFPGRRAGLWLFLMVQMFPGAVLLLPLFMVLSELRLLDSTFGLIVAYSTVSLPFCVWMLKSFFDTVPRAILEAAEIDGLSPVQTFYRIILPLSLPGLAVTGFFSFITAWNEFMFANTFLFDSRKMTLAVGLKTFLSEKQNYWELLTPGAILVTLPVLLFFVAAQRWLVSGLTAGAVKE